LTYIGRGHDFVVENSIYQVHFRFIYESPLSTSRHLVEVKHEETYFNSEETQTDPFKALPAARAYQPKRKGKDVSTHIEENDLFRFDREVEPLLDVRRTHELFFILKCQNCHK
jgi:hypothetical protein